MEKSFVGSTLNVKSMFRCLSDMIKQRKTNEKPNPHTDTQGVRKEMQGYYVC